ncbi:MAG TPA: hypothetical protein VH741_02400, partial [Candidatus Limnocylindrales bacterium]
RKAIGDARRTVADSAEQVSKGAGQAASRATELGHGVRGAVDDLRSLRVVRQQPPRRDPWPGLALIGGIGAGVAAMFLLDPRDGARRRALVRDKLGRWSRVAAREARGRSKDIANRTQGLIHEVRSAIPAREVDEPQPMTEGQPDWPSQEPVAAGVGAGVGMGASDYGELTQQPYAPNGRDNS